MKVAKAWSSIGQCMRVSKAWGSIGKCMRVSRAWGSTWQCMRFFKAWGSIGKNKRKRFFQSTRLHRTMHEVFQSMGLHRTMHERYWFRYVYLTMRWLVQRMYRSPKSAVFGPKRQVLLMLIVEVLRCCPWERKLKSYLIWIALKSMNVGEYFE